VCLIFPHVIQTPRITLYQIFQCPLWHCVCSYCACATANSFHWLYFQWQYL